MIGTLTPKQKLTSSLSIDSPVKLEIHFFFGRDARYTELIVGRLLSRES